MATQCVRHQKSPNFGRFMPSGTVAVPAWPTPMPLYMNNILFILMIIYGDSSYLFTRLVAYTAENAGIFKEILLNAQIHILPITVHIHILKTTIRMRIVVFNKSHIGVFYTVFFYYCFSLALFDVIFFLVFTI